MRIAVGGIMHESNTFLPLVTRRKQFEEGSLTSGEALVQAWQTAHHEMGGFLAGAREFAFEAVPTIMAWATPAGPVDDAVLDEVVAGIVDGCKRSQPDGLLVSLHGAMVTGKHPSGDTEVLRRLRAALGTMPIVVSLDYHGNVTPEMGELAQGLVGYQTYPHVDQRQVGLKAAEIVSRAVRGEIRPVCAVAKPP